MTPEEVISLSAGAELLGITRQRAGQLAKDGWITKTGKGGRLVDIVRGYIAFLRDENRRASKSAAHSRLQDVRVRKEELAIAERERELVPLADAMEVVDRIVGSVHWHVGAIPARFTRDIAQRAALQAEVDLALNAVADEMQKLGDAFRSGQEEV